MICLLVLTSHEGPLEAEIRDDMSGEYDSLKGAPRGLLPSGVAEKQIIDIWWDAVSKRHIFSKGANLCASALRSSWLGLQRLGQRLTSGCPSAVPHVAGGAVYLITNANKYKYYERWATAHDFPM
jgi:glucuronokinase